MRSLDIQRNFNKKNGSVQLNDAINSNWCQVTTYDGTVFTNLKCDTDCNLKNLNKILKKNNIHFIYPTGKDASLKISGDSTNSVIFPANNMSVFFSERHSKKGFSLHSVEDLEVSILSLNDKLLKRFCKTFEEKLLNNGYHSNFTESVSLAHPSGVQRITDAIDNILRFWNEDKPESAILKAAVTELQCILLQHYLILNSENILSDSEILKINSLPSIIANHETVELTADHLSQLIDMEPVRLQLGCEIVFKQNPIDLINSLKLENVVLQLATQSCHLSEIAYKNGFTNRSHFYEAFEKNFKCSPKEYRNHSETAQSNSYS